MEEERNDTYLRDLSARTTRWILIAATIGALAIGLTLPAVFSVLEK
jgi:hypothetical protein